MAEPRIAFDLMTATDVAKAEALANQLDTHNSQRQIETRRGVEYALEHVGIPLDVKEAMAARTRDPVVCILGDWGSGVNGLIATELTERYCVPAFVGARDKEGNVAVSARSVAGVNVRDLQFEAYDADPGCIVDKGNGHAAASGFRTRVELWPRVVEQLGLIARTVVPTDNLVPVITIDAPTTLFRLKGTGALEAIQRLEPFGHDFEAPIFLVPRVCVSSKQRFGAEGQHLRMMAKSGNDRVKAVVFNCDPELANVPEGVEVDLVVNFGKNDYNGTYAPQMTIRDWRYSSGAPPATEPGLD
jgi:single-stranded-DNA-specific exonuclease